MTEGAPLYDRGVVSDGGIWFYAGHLSYCHMMLMASVFARERMHFPWTNSNISKVHLHYTVIML